MTALSPNSAIPIGYRKKIAADTGADAPKHAAGIVYVAPDGDILLLRRSNAEANYAGHWALPGGGADDGESPEDAARREAKEEMGVDSDAPMRPLDRRITPTGSAYHTFASPAATKFAPKLNDEHTGYAWASLNMLPRPLHPAVEQTLKDQIGITEDMKPEQWKGAADGFVKWATCAADFGATDSALRLALDRDTVREKRRDGQLYVSRAKITKANICPYRGREIPGAERIGLDPDAIYQLYRDPDELAKGAPTLNGVQLLKKHQPVNAQDHLPDETVGAMGTNAEFVDGELFNDLIIWSKEGVDLVESNKQKELSAGYHYVPDMTAGEIDGMRYDGVMRDIVFNHVALVEDGRAGDDVVVGDSSEGLMSKVVALTKRYGSIRVMQAYLKPVIAMDSAMPKMGDIFEGVTGKNFPAMRGKITERLKGVKLAQDANLDDVEKVLDLLEKHEVKGGTDEVIPPTDQNAMGEAAAQAPEPLLPVDNKPKGFDAEGVKKFCADRGMSADDIAQLSGMFPKAAAADAEEDDDKDNDKDKDADKDKKKPPFGQDGEKDKDMVSKPAMDAALKAHGDAVAKRVIREQNEIRKAMSDVRPWIGEIPGSMAFDSADGVYRHALTTLGIDGAKDLHTDALLPVLKAQPQAGAKPNQLQGGPRLAMDSTARDAMKLAVPGLDLDRIGRA